MALGGNDTVRVMWWRLSSAGGSIGTDRQAGVGFPDGGDGADGGPRDPGQCHSGGDARDHKVHPRGEIRNLLLFLSWLLIMLF